MDSEKVSVKAFLVQGSAALAISALTTLTGLVFSWPSYNVANFISNGTVLQEPMTSLQVSLLGSLTNVGAMILTPFCGYFVNNLGRKYSAMLFGLPFVLTWSIISVTTSIPMVLTAVALAGFGTAGQTISSIYISEIVQDSIRGAMMSTVVSSYFLGVLISYILGGVLSYYQIIYIDLTMSVLYVVLLAFLKESPVFLMQRGREKEAAESIAFYRRVSVTAKEVQVEIAKIKLLLDPRLEKMLEGSDEPTVTKELIENPPEEKKLSEWQFLKQSPTSIRALTTSFACMATMILMGNIAFQVYAETLFQEAVPSYDSNQCSVFLAIILLLASVICSFIIDKFGRKPLMILTAAIASVCTLLLGVQLQFDLAPEWVSAFIIYVYSFIFNVGVAVIPYVLSAELFLPEVRGLCGSITMTSGWALNFITVLLFTPAIEVVGIPVMFYIFSVVGFVGATYCFFNLPETKGLSVDAIQLLFVKKTKRKNEV
ncbi:facilitated trehalose transporter Tret1-like [Trichoplusia ni]|uniref:Facilitated trehalose transporter Tret1-like n=1 Tax=Trichoplusia ni TaxID=7111 RepID=A0A7E5VIG5_TRINI|nr:facilitated trehalose transporter Tret1-like [Trichoplusia ni]